MISILFFVAFLFGIYDNLSDSLKEGINYLIVGGLTTVVSIVSYYLLRLVIENYIVCTVLSWIVAVIFAYFTNRKYVFHSKEKNLFKEFSTFIFSRILSLIAEVLVMFLLVDIISINDKIAKIVVQVIVIVLNYIFSKLFVFKGKGK